jgi:sortilin (neurotensin receptor 3)
VGFGDGFATLPIQSDPMIGYAMSQEGYIVRWNLRTGERKDIRPSPPLDQPDLRFNWNAAIAADPFNGDGLYFGSQYVHKSTDRGETWTTISPDLTSNRKDWQNQAKSGGLTYDVTGAENFTTVIALAPSPLDRNVVWAGSDDGRVHVTKDGGATWSSVEANIKGVPANTWVPEIKASRHDAGTAFIVLDDHRRSNWTPYVYRTTDYGKTWTSLVTKDIQGYAHAIEQDPVDPELLFLGTEFGLWVSTDAGRNWMKWKHNFPTVSVMGLAVHPRDHDLVVATHGRAAYVIDDIRPLRTISKDTLAKPLHLFEVPAAQAYVTRQKEGSRFLGDAEFRGENEPYGALLTYSLNLPNLPHPVEEKERARKAKEREAAQKLLVTEAGAPPDVPKEPEATSKDVKKDEPKKDDKAKEVDIEVADASGKVIRKLKGPAILGVNRASWDLTRDAFKRPTVPGQEPNRGEGGGPEIPPGDYTVTIKFRGQEAKQAVRVVADPRDTFTPEQRQAKYDAVLRAGKVQETAVEAINRITKTRNDIDAVAAKLKKEDDDPSAEPPPLVKSGTALKTKLDAMEKRLWTPPKTKGIPAENDVMAKIGYPFYSLQSSWDAPTAAQLTYLERAEKQLRETLVDYNKMFAEDVAKYREEVRKTNVVLLTEEPPL